MAGYRYPEALRIIDQLGVEVDSRMQEKGTPISCAKGCSHCCSMLIEITWDEALVLADWLEAQPSPSQELIRKRVRIAARERREFFLGSKSTVRYTRPTRKTQEISFDVCERYFYSKSRQCPLLEDDICSAYSARPSACRLHMVTSPSERCVRTRKGGADFEVPEEIEELREEIEDSIEVDDARWGELSILLDTVLRSREEALSLGAQSDSLKKVA